MCEQGIQGSQEGIQEDKQLEIVMNVKIVKNGWMKLTLSIGNEVLEKTYNPMFFSLIGAKADFIDTYIERMVENLFLNKLTQELEKEDNTLIEQTNRN